MTKNTYYIIMNELDNVVAVAEERNEAKEIAKNVAQNRREMLWVIDVLNDNEVAVYDENGNEW